MPDKSTALPRFCGQAITERQLELIRRITARYSRLSRTELAATTCELLEWLRPNGKPKTVECRAFLEKLEQQQQIVLPPQRKKRAKRTAVAISPVEQQEQTPVQVGLGQLQPVHLQRVTTAEQRNRWRSLVEQHHYLGHKIPFGAHLRYFVQSEQGVIGCLQYSSPAWRLQARDSWIGWTDSQRQNQLQHIICNSRFLILPWLRVPNLASHVLAQATRYVVVDWHEHFGVTPWLLETLVDSRRFQGVCYRAANWVLVGETTGRGRNDRHHQRHDAAPKSVWLYPLHRHCRDRLHQGV